MPTEPLWADESTEAIVTNKIRTVEFVAADARCHVHEAVARGDVGAGEQRSDSATTSLHLEVEQTILDVVRAGLDDRCRESSIQAVFERAISSRMP